VTGPNPDIEPPTSDKVDLFYSRIQGCAKTGTTGGSSIDLRDSSAPATKTYAVLTSEQQGARIKGIELSYEQPFGSPAPGSGSTTAVASLFMPCRTISRSAS
jgi:iron complex outermembrane receptor protein